MENHTEVLLKAPPIVKILFPRRLVWGRLSEEQEKMVKNDEKQ